MPLHEPEVVLSKIKELEPEVLRFIQALDVLMTKEGTGEQIVERMMKAAHLLGSAIKTVLSIMECPDIPIISRNLVVTFATALNKEQVLIEDIDLAAKVVAEINRCLGEKK